MEVSAKIFDKITCYDSNDASPADIISKTYMWLPIVGSFIVIKVGGGENDQLA
jgi:hypothetical protein